MEGFPNQERIISKEEVIEAIKSKGIEDSEVLELAKQWTVQQEKIVEEVGTAEASIVLNMDRADLYLAEGDTEGAWEALEDARLQAHLEGHTDLYEKIMAKMDEIEAGL